MTLHYREPGKRPGTTRAARRKVESVWAGLEWIHSNPGTAMFPATVTNGWGNVVAFFGGGR